MSVRPVAGTVVTCQWQSLESWTLNSCMTVRWNLDGSCKCNLDAQTIRDKAYSRNVS